jgi:hypothetical protein
MTTAAPASPNMLSVNVGGLNVNYDLGPSTATVASQAYSFLGNSFSNDSALLGNTIIGSQNFVSSFATPILQMAQQQQSFNDTVLPNMFNTLQSNNFTIGQEAIGAQTQSAAASIAASQAEAANAPKGGGGCYITTAICKSLGFADDCYILNTLRRFRDTFMVSDAERKAMVDQYYDSAPFMVELILARDDAAFFLRRLAAVYIMPAIRSIEEGDNFGALTLYRAMVLELRDIFRPILPE